MILKEGPLSQLIRQIVGSLIPKQLFKLIVILIGYVVLPIYHVGIFSMRVQHVNESLNSKLYERMRIFISVFPRSWAYIQEHLSPQVMGGP